MASPPYIKTTLMTPFHIHFLARGEEGGGRRLYVVWAMNGAYY